MDTVDIFVAISNVLARLQNVGTNALVVISPDGISFVVNRKTAFTEKTSSTFLDALTSWVNVNL